MLRGTVRPWVLAVCLALPGGTLLAQAPAPAPDAPKKPAPQRKKASKAKPSPTPSLADLAKAMDAQQAAIAKLQADLDAERKRHDEEREALRKQIAALEAQLAEMSRTHAEIAAAGPAPTPTPPPAVAEAHPKPEKPADQVATDFPGAIRVPGTGASFRIGGVVWASMIETFDALGSDDRFLTYSIPVEGTPEAGKGARLSFFAAPSRLNFDIRTPFVKEGNLRAFIEADFAGQGNAFRLRHAYLQIPHWLFGQTWSAFSDPDADVEDTDFEGINAENVQRQTQLRYWWDPKEKLRLRVSLEYPNASITDVDGSVVSSVNQVPDIVAAADLTTAQDGHVQVAGVLRNIRGESEAAPNSVHKALGWGLSVSGVIPALPWPFRDHVIFQLNAGAAVARYINDLNSAGGQDAAFDPATGEMELIRAIGWYLAYEHRWKGIRGEKGYVRSSLIWGEVIEENLDFQPGTAYRKTNRLSLNLLWNPVTDLSLGAELIWGQRIDKDGSRGAASQLQLRTRYFF